MFGRSIRVNKKEAFGANSSERVNVFNKVQSNTHIILSHCPPFGIRDEEFLVDEYEHVGCAHLLHAIEKIQPIACIFAGHNIARHSSANVGPNLEKQTLLEHKTTLCVVVCLSVVTNGPN